MFEKFTDRSRKVMQLANQEAQRFNHEYIGTEHILLGLIKEGSGVAAHVLKNLSIDLHMIRHQVEEIVQSGPDMITQGKLPQTPRAKKVIEYALEEARDLGHNYVGTEHLLLGLLREQEGVGAQVLMNLGARLDVVREEVLNLLGPVLDRTQGLTRRSPARTPTLDVFCHDLTELALNGKLPPVVGRQADMERVLIALGCRARTWPLLVGPPGVGKTAVVHGLAQRAAGVGAPEILRDQRLLSLGVWRLLAETRDDTERFMKVLRGLLKEVKQAGNVIFFVPDLLDSGRDGRLLQTVLAEAGARCLAATTTETYRTAVLADAASARLFQPVFVEPPAPEEAVAMIRAHRELLQTHHEVTLADDAFPAAVELSERHAPEGALPGKALRLLDQAASLYRIQCPRPLPDTKEIEARIRQLEEQKEAAITEQDFEKAAHARDQSVKLQREKDDLLKQWRQRRPPFPGAVDARAVEEVVTRTTDERFRAK